MAHVLIIDDEDDIRCTVKEALGRAGHTVIEAADGGKGLREFREAPIDIVITDLLMPHKEGIETIIKLREISPHVKIIAISGGGKTGKTDFLDLAQQLGADVKLKKPFLIDELHRAVNDLLGLRIG